MNESKAITVYGRAWNLDITDGEPRVRDIDLAERAGLKQPRDIRKLIQRCREELEDFGPLDVRVRRTRTSIARGGFRDRTVNEFWLTESQATAILLQLRTPQARRLRGIVVKVFRAALHGELPVLQRVPVPVASNSPTLGDFCRLDIKRHCKYTARSMGTSTQQIQGWVRILYPASSVYKISAAHRDAVVRLLECWAKGTAPTPTPPRRLLSSPKPRQGVLPFPETIQ